MTQHTILNLLHPRLKVGIVGLAPTAILADDQLPDAPFKIDLNLMEADSGTCLVQATLVNTGASPLRVKGFRWQHDPAVKGGPALHFPDALRPQVFATENLRGDYFGTGTVEGDRWRGDPRRRLQLDGFPRPDRSGRRGRPDSGGHGNRPLNGRRRPTADLHRAGGTCVAALAAGLCRGFTVEDIREPPHHSSGVGRERRRERLTIRLRLRLRPPCGTDNHK